MGVNFDAADLTDLRSEIDATASLRFAQAVATTTTTTTTYPIYEESAENSFLVEESNIALFSLGAIFPPLLLWTALAEVGESFYETDGTYWGERVTASAHAKFDVVGDPFSSHVVTGSFLRPSVDTGTFDEKLVVNNGFEFNQLTTYEHRCFNEKSTIAVAFGKSVVLPTNSFSASVGTDEECRCHPVFGTESLDECGVCGGDDKSCTGCMDEQAFTYDSDATINDVNQCEYVVEDDEASSTVVGLTSLMVVVAMMWRAVDV